MNTTGELNEWVMFCWSSIWVCNDCRQVVRFSQRWQKIIMRIQEAGMKLTEFCREEIDREVERSRKALAQAPSGKSDWKPHDRSMAFGYLANMVATMPMWVQMQIERDELDVAPPQGHGTRPEPKETSDELIKALNDAVNNLRPALEKTTDEHLRTNWKLLAGGKV